MRTEEECFKHAEFCERRAKTAKDATKKAPLPDSAQHWRKLANDRGALRAQPFMRSKRA
jgi:hypothetical protein